MAIAVPLSLRETLLPEEEISLRHLSHYLGDYDAFFIAPRGSTVGSGTAQASATSMSRRTSSALPCQPILSLEWPRCTAR